MKSLYMLVRNNQCASFYYGSAFNPCFLFSGDLTQPDYRPEGVRFLLQGRYGVPVHASWKESIGSLDFFFFFHFPHETVSRLYPINKLVGFVPIIKPRGSWFPEMDCSGETGICISYVH